MESQKIITMNELLNKYTEDENVFKTLPEFSFLQPLAETIKRKGCRCGQNQALHQAQETFNQTVSNFDESATPKMKFFFLTEKLCFGVQTVNNFEIKCY